MSRPTLTFNNVEVSVHAITRRHADLADLMLVPAETSLDGRVKFDHWTGSWHVWDGHRFAPDAKGAIYELFERHARWLITELAGIREVKLDAVLPLLDKPTQRHVLDTLSHRPSVAMVGDEWDQVGHLLGVRNGVVDLRTKALRDGQPSDLITKATGAEYDAAAPRPDRFLRFLGEIYGGDEAMVRFMQRAIGALLVGGHMKAFLLLLGDTDTGKTTLVNTIAAMLGDYAVPLGIKSFAKAKWQGASNSHTRDLMGLPGSRFVHVVESDEGVTLDVTRLKSMTGGEPQLLAGAYSRHERRHPVTWKIWLGTNTAPQVTDESDATWQRMQAIPHNVRFWRPDDPTRPVDAPMQDATLAARLQDELPGILRLAVEWAHDYLMADRQLLPLPQAGRALRDELHEDDALAEWFELNMVIDPAGEVGAREAFDSYTHWAARRDIEPVSIVQFGKLLKKRARDKSKAGGYGFRYRGIRFATAAELGG